MAAFLSVGGGALADSAKTKSGLPIPRFVSIRANEVNMRTGPGRRYPVEWVLIRRSMPVEVIDEFQTWRKIRDWEGTVGWVHQRMISGRRTVLITGQRRLLRRQARASAPPVAGIDPGVIARVMDCERAWCHVDIGGIDGWLKRTEIWGVYKGETIE
jgi:SH3-like domain-containing protein